MHVITSAQNNIMRQKVLHPSAPYFSFCGGDIFVERNWSKPPEIQLPALRTRIS